MPPVKGKPITKIRANFMLAFESVQGRKVIISRKLAKEFVEKWPPDKMGPLGIKVKYPHWLFRGIPFNYHVGYGNYCLPWKLLNEYQS